MLINRKLTYKLFIQVAQISFISTEVALLSRATIFGHKKYVINNVFLVRF